MKILSLLLTLCFSVPLLATPESRIVAVINKDVITERDLNNRMKLAFLSSGLKDTPNNREQLREQILHAMIDEILQLQAIDADEIYVSEEDIQSAIENMEKVSGQPTGSTVQLLKANHIPSSVIENQAKAYLGWNERLQKNYLPGFNIPDHKVQWELEKLQGEQKKTQYHLAEIYIPIDAHISADKAKQDALKLRTDIQRGASFAAVAQQFSQSATAARGGDLGWLSEDFLNSEYLDALNTMKPGQISQPIRLSRGYALLAYIARQVPGEAIDTEISVLQVKIPYPFLPTDYEIKDTLQKLTSLGNKANSCLAFRSSVSKINGHQIQESGTLSISQVTSDIHKLIKNLSPGQATNALPTENGAIAFMVCHREVIKPQEWTQDSIKNMLIDRHLKLLSRRDLRDLKKHAFIEIR